MALEAWPEGNETVFRVNDAGLRRLEPVAGPLAVVMTGRIKVVARVKIGAGGLARIVGDDASELALILMSGSVALDLGSQVNGTPQLRRPESLTYYGLPPARPR
jgi:hypothetical protein